MRLAAVPTYVCLKCGSEYDAHVRHAIGSTIPVIDFNHTPAFIKGTQDLCEDCNKSLTVPLSNYSIEI